LLCMKIMIFTKITLLFPKIKCEPQESNAVGKADFLTELKSSEFRIMTGKAHHNDLSLRRLIMFKTLLQLNYSINSKILLNLSLSTAYILYYNSILHIKTSEIL
jgi:hypothetical protein